jgi:hypothetical protein
MGRKKLNRRQVLANMNSENFRIDRLESTPKEIEHTEHRFDTLKLGQLEGRIARMTNPWKLIATIRVAKRRGLVGMARNARMKLNIILDSV